MFIKIYLKQKIKKKQAIAVPFTIFVNWKSLFTITLYNEKKKKKKETIDFPRRTTLWKTTPSFSKK